MRMPSTLCLISILFCSILSLAQTQTIQVTGPDQTSGPVTITLQINAPNVCSVNMLPTSVTLAINNTQQFTATTTGCSPSTVFYQVNGVTGGNATVGTISVGGLYTAPASVPTPATVTVTAVSNQDNTKVANSSVTIQNPPPPCTISIVPTSANLNTNATQQFTATTNGCSPSTVTYTVNGVTGGNSTVGTINGTGLYTAPANVPTPNNVTVCGVSNQTSGPSACANVVLSAPPVCSVSISPISGPPPIIVNMFVNSTQQFTVVVSNCTPSTVTWKVNNITGGNSTIGTITTGGLYTSPATVPSPNSVTVTVVSNADSTKTSSATVNIFTPSASVVDKYCAPGDVYTGAPTDGPANLPKTCYYTDPSIMPSGGTIRNVGTTVASWNAAWAATQCGDIVEGTAGATLVGNVTIPTLTCPTGKYVWFRTSGYASLPGYGQKVSPCYAGVGSLVGRPDFNCQSLTNQMFTIQGSGNYVLTMSTGIQYMRITGIVFTRSLGSGITFSLINANAGGINHIIIDHNWAKGTDQDETKQFINLNRTSYIALLSNYSSDLVCISVTGSCTDSQFVGGGDNSNATDNDNTWKIVGNFAESAAQCILFGGGAASIIPTDIEIRNNWCFKPLTWNPSDPTYISSNFGGHPPEVKNCMELKTGIRVLYEGNVCQNVWGGFSQVGNAWTLTPKSQASGTSNQCPICSVQHITIRYNYTTHVWQPLQIANVANDNGAYATAGNTYSIHDDTYDDVRYGTCFGCSGTTVLFFEDGAVPASEVLKNVNINHQTIILNSSATLSPGGSVPLFLSTNGNATTATNYIYNVLFQNSLFASVGGIGTPGGGGCALGLSQTALLNNCWGSSATTKLWSQVTLPASAGHVDGFDIKQSNNHWFITDRFSGNWKSLDQGQTWNPINNGLPVGSGVFCQSAGTNNCGWTILVNPVTGDLIYNQQGNPSFFWKSTDETNFTKIPVPSGFNLTSTGSFDGGLMPSASNNVMLLGGRGCNGCTLMYSTDNAVTTHLSVITPSDGETESTGVNGTTYAQGGEASGFHTSTNGGANFTQVWNCVVSVGPTCASGTGSPSDSNEIYVTTTDGAGNWVIASETGVLKSGGPVANPTSWTRLHRASQRSRALLRDTYGNYWYSQSQVTGTGTVFLSTDNGVTWPEYDSGIGTGLETHRFVQNTNDNNVYALVENGTGNAANIYNIAITPYLFSGNAIIANNQGTNWPANNCLVSGGFSTIVTNYNNGVGGNYTVQPSSPCHLAGNDGKDPGSNQSLEQSYWNGVNIF